MRDRFLRLLMTAALFGAFPTAVSAKNASEFAKTLTSQKAGFEDRIAGLQREVDDLFADQFYCSAEERTEAYNKIRDLQRQITTLRIEYNAFKAGAIKTAATPGYGPQLDAAGIHPDDRKYWTEDDNALVRLRDSALAKANRIEQAPYRDCSAPKSSLPPQSPPSPKPPKTAPEQPAAPTQPPSSSGGQRPSSGCTDNEAAARRLRIQDEILRVERELIPIDGTTKEGRARQLELRAELERLERLLRLDCPPLIAQLPGPPTTPANATEQVGYALSSKLKSINDEALQITNAERIAVGVPALRLDPALVQHAQSYADELARMGKMTHAPREGRGIERENISQGLPWWSVRQHLESWRKEKAKFVPGIFPNVAFNGNWYEVGHWTQWIWQNTTAVGCGMAIGGGSSWFVCRYSPGGDKDGVPVGFPVAEACMRQPSKGGPPAKEGSGDESSIKGGLKYEFAGATCAPYQETKVPQPELPKKEVFKTPEPKPGELDPL